MMGESRWVLPDSLAGTSLETHSNRLFLFLSLIHQTRGSSAAPVSSSLLYHHAQCSGLGLGLELVLESGVGRSPRLRARTCSRAVEVSFVVSAMAQHPMHAGGASATTRLPPRRMGGSHEKAAVALDFRHSAASYRIIFVVVCVFTPLFSISSASRFPPQ